MIDPHSNVDPIHRETAPQVVASRTPDEPMDDEEKVIANRLDANMPALLTRDVLGG